MNNLIIDKDFLSKSKTLMIGFENCDVYQIDAKEVLDIYCNATSIGNRNGYRAHEGYIKISSNASKINEIFATHADSAEICGGTFLEERLRWCNGWADITCFSLEGGEHGRIDVYLPYDPLESALTGGEIELSNCPSFETDTDGNMLIYFGESSKQPTRKDNDYPNLVMGWKEAFGDYSPEALKVKALELSSFGEDQNNLSLIFNVPNKKRGKKM